jgi:ubiquinone/menaquinone biosynthesis C-methylase UbiE
MTEPIRFEDGAAYERFMGIWSQLVGTQFLEWIAPGADWHWVDVGCGNGAFTDLIVQHAAPASVHGVDPSEAQLEFARARFADGPAASRVRFDLGHALALPCETASCDAAVMPLVLSFVPDAAAGVAEMARVVRPGGVVSAYMWDMESGGFPYHVLHDRIRARGGVVPLPPHPESSRRDVTESLWRAAGLRDVATTTIRVTRTFASFDDFWETAKGGPSAGQSLRAMSAHALAGLREEMAAALPLDAEGVVVLEGWANAVRGTV